jgi:DNA invertase Pin-like site-specific DNA recombinase
LNTKANNAILVVAKLDRLARDVSFTSALYNGNDFVCCDNPSANKLTIQILSVIAENEAEMISVRTKETLAIKKLI